MARTDPTPLLLDPYNGGLSVARSLVRAGLRPVVVAGPGNAHVARARGVEGHVVPFDGDGAQWLEQLRALAARGEHLLVTGGDVASDWLARRRADLPAGIRCFEALDDAHVPLLAKDTSEAIARAAGVAVPWTARVADAAALEAAISNAPYPAVLKPVLSHAWRAVFGDDRVLLVDGPDDARREGERALAAGQTMILSEYIPGTDADVEEAIVVRAPDGSYPVAFGCQKIRQYPVGFGAASLCEIAELPESMALARAVLDQAGFVGVAGVETKRHAGNGRRYFLEVNVRIPTQFGLGDAAGLDASQRMLAVLAGRDPGPQPPIGRRARLVFAEQEVRAAVSALRSARGQRLQAARALARSYAGVRDVGIFDVRDPVPGATLIASALRRRLPGR